MQEQETTPSTKRVRGKFQCTKTELRDYGAHTEKVFFFEPRYDEKCKEDVHFSKATPTGHIQMRIDNEIACIRHLFYVVDRRAYALLPVMRFFLFAFAAVGVLEPCARLAAMWYIEQQWL